MKIFLDTANINDIAYWHEKKIIDGVTTNPTNLSAVKKNPTKVVKEIIKLLPEGVISIEVTENDPKKVYKQAQAISALGKNVAVKIPCYADYYEVIKRLVDEEITLNITLVFSLVQSFMMCKLGVAYISPFVGRLEDNDSDGIGLLYNIRHMIDTYGFSTNILAASIRSVEHFDQALLSGCDAITMSAKVLEKAVSHVLTDQGMKHFHQDWKKLKVTKFP